MITNIKGKASFYQAALFLGAVALQTFMGFKLVVDFKNVEKQNYQIKQEILSTHADYNHDNIVREEEKHKFYGTLVEKIEGLTYNVIENDNKLKAIVTSPNGKVIPQSVVEDIINFEMTKINPNLNYKQKFIDYKAFF